MPGYQATTRFALAPKTIHLLNLRSYCYLFFTISYYYLITLVVQSDTDKIIDICFFYELENPVFRAILSFSFFALIQDLSRDDAIRIALFYILPHFRHFGITATLSFRRFQDYSLYAYFYYTIQLLIRVQIDQETITSSLAKRLMLDFSIDKI